ncbi:hypothetical protein [Paraliomyxa miuraensis]|uniref:hypothetical protein n=1 Tax=Paraliomyxa miuraensis TaxID=376150 RepID=UPI00225846E9|nr:hypothetical protein [Paraliomyxa miuraensis]MCX4242684.1 hypothetical protein [Paraliomyxa miuraensis]
MPIRRLHLLGLALVLGCKSPDSGDEETSTTSTTRPDPTTAMETSSDPPGTTVEPDPTSGTTAADATTVSVDDGPIFDVGGMDDVSTRVLPDPQLWYSVEDLIVYIALDPADGSVVQLVTSTITNDPPLLTDAPGVVEFNSITMLDDGSLLGARGVLGQTQLYHVAAPPTVATDLEVDVLGNMADALFIEALYTDCEGRVYLMDTGVDSSNSVGNRLIRFTGNYLAGDFSYEVITDLAVAVAADIDDMAPGIDGSGAITDNPGFAIDSGEIYDFDYTTGTGTSIGMAGTYGIHALGGALFDDGVSRLYVMTLNAELFEADPVTLAVSPVLATGPMVVGPPFPGMSGMTGPLTDCMTSFPEG